MTAREFILGIKDRVTPEAVAGKEDTRFHFKVAGDEGGEFTATLENGKFDVVEGLEGEPKCVITTSDQVLMDIIKGKQKPMSAIMFGKLKISNLSEMTKYAKALGLM